MSKTALITGSSSGIGAFAALEFAKNGCNVILNCRKNVSGMEDIQHQLEQYNVRVETFAADVGDYKQVKNMFDRLFSINLIPDIIINNAGISHIGLLQDMTADQWQKVINTNLTSVFNTSKAAIPYLLQKNGGKIINISSMWGNVGASCEVAYSASKGGVNAFTKALAKELAPSHIQVNAIAFGAVDTRMNDFLDEEERAMLVDEIPAGRILSVSEAARIIWQTSLYEEYVTGQIITADGGMT